MSILRYAGCVALACVATRVASAQASFTWLPTAPRPDGTTFDLHGAYGFSISDDGKTVAGFSRRNSTTFAAIWRRDTNGAYLGQTLPRLPIPGNPFPMSATDVSADGGRVVGASFENGLAWDTGSGAYLPAIGQWRNPHVDFSSGSAQNRGRRAMSSDGHFAADYNWERVTLDTGSLTALPFPSDRPIDFVAGATISRDGNSMAGLAWYEDPQGEIHQNLVRWREGLGTEAVEIIPSNSVDEPSHILDDGTVLAYSSDPVGGYQVCRWMPDGMLVGTGIRAPLFACSVDGSLLAGGNEVWTQATGTVSLESFLGPGVLPSGYSFHVDAVSANGQYWIVNARDATNSFEVSGVVTVPAPGSIVGVALGWLAFGRRHRRSTPA